MAKGKIELRVTGMTGDGVVRNIESNRDKAQDVTFPPVAGGVALIAGTVLVFAGRKT
jgi:hypothetical protein